MLQRALEAAWLPSSLTDCRRLEELNHHSASIRVFKWYNEHLPSDQMESTRSGVHDRIPATESMKVEIGLLSAEVLLLAPQS